MTSLHTIYFVVKKSFVASDLVTGFELNVTYETNQKAAKALRIPVSGKSRFRIDRVASSKVFTGTLDVWGELVDANGIKASGIVVLKSQKGCLLTQSASTATH